MKKKILSMALVCALMFSVSQTAGATEVTVKDGVYSQDVEAGSEVEVPTIKITLSDTTGKIVAINPYQLKYTDADGVESTDVLPNKEETITNASNVAIAVNVTTKAEVATPSEAVLATAPLKGTETTKSVFAFLYVDSKAAEDATLTAPDGYDAKSAKHIIFAPAAKAMTKKAMITLDAAESEDAPTYAGYKIFGDVASSPAKTWSNDDKITFKMTFQFEPVLIKPAASK